MRFALARWLNDLMPLAPLYAALALTVWIGGLGPALVPAILGYLACYYFFFAPFNTFGGWDARNILGLLLHLFTSTSIILIGMTARAARQKLEEQQARLLASEESARTARDRAETALAAIREGQRHKDEFLATLAHELRNPLAPIRNMLEVLKQDGDGSAREHARDIIERQTVRLIRLVDDLLDTSRITLGKLDLRKERIELGAVLNQAL